LRKEGRGAAPKKRGMVCVQQFNYVATVVRFIAWVYIMTNTSRSVLYTGFTTRIDTRPWEHATRRNEKAFTAKYYVNQLVYVQGFLSIDEARDSELFIKGKTRAWKIALIEKHNPKWKNLYDEVLRGAADQP
jgi:putative endonuclease